MPTQMKSGLSGGAAENNINVVQWHTGLRLVRATVVSPSDTVDARAILSRVTLDNLDDQSPYTLLSS